MLYFLRELLFSFGHNKVDCTRTFSSTVQQYLGRVVVRNLRSTRSVADTSWPVIKVTQVPNSEVCWWCTHTPYGSPYHTLTAPHRAQHELAMQAPAPRGQVGPGRQSGRPVRSLCAWRVTLQAACRGAGFTSPSFWPPSRTRRLKVDCQGCARDVYNQC